MSDGSLDPDLMAEVLRNLVVADVVTDAGLGALDGFVSAELPLAADAGDLPGTVAALGLMDSGAGLKHPADYLRRNRELALHG